MKSWEDLKAEQDFANHLVLTYAFQDRLNGEKVFTKKSEKTIRKKLQQNFGYIPQHAVQDREYGDVLNRFPLRVSKTLNMIPYRMWPIVGSFQK
jgi:hypothetical protein